VLQCFTKFSTCVHRLGQVKCCKMVWNIRSAPGWSRFSWYQVRMRKQRLVGITTFPLKYTNSARWIILVLKSGSLFVMHRWIFLLASCASDYHWWHIVVTNIQCMMEILWHLCHRIPLVWLTDVNRCTDSETQFSLYSSADFTWCDIVVTDKQCMMKILWHLCRRFPLVRHSSH
jgi:hypothetical protein